ncbi:MAG: EamA family transporter RarD [Candidatus Nanopelagicales bacterium]
MLFGLLAYGLWGIFPLYFALLGSVSPLEVVAHRIIWTLVLLVIVITIARTWRTVRAALNKRTLLILLGAAVFISVNWLVYVYAVDTDQVVQTSLGYFINPLISVALGVILLRERLRALQWVAVGIAVIAVAVLTVSYGTVPWISLTLAFSFGMYGFLKKLARVGSIESLAIETAALAPFALALMAMWEADGQAAFVLDGWQISLLLILLGPITALPLLAFGGAATRIPLSTLGVLQYMTPTMLFLIGVFLFNEAMPTSRWIGFLFVWVSLVVFSIDVYQHGRRTNKSKRAELLEEIEVSEPT